MNTNASIEKMEQMRLYGMKRAYESSFETRGGNQLTNDEFIAWLIEAEHNDRGNRKNHRLVKNARFRYQAYLDEISYGTDRGLDKNQVARLADCSFIDRGENIIVTGSTGTGKSFLASALGHQACSQGYKTLYFNLGKLFSKMLMSKADGSYMKETAKIEKHDLVILDDFGLQAIDRDKQHILLDILEDRHHKRSTIIASQVPVSVWYDLIDEKTIADAILDRIVHSAHRIEIKGESMRKKMKKELA